MTRAEKDGALVELTLDDDLAAALAAFHREASTASGIEGDIRHILRLWLTEKGYLAARADEGLKPESLNASNDG